jgi:hypothetical protein
MGNVGGKQNNRPKIKGNRQSERLAEITGGVGSENLAEMSDKLIGEIGRNAAFPPCQSCGLAMVIVQITPRDDRAYEERMFKCPKCGVMEAKTVEIK